MTDAEAKARILSGIEAVARDGGKSLSPNERAVLIDTGVVEIHDDTLRLTEDGIKIFRGHILVPAIERMEDLSEISNTLDSKKEGWSRRFVIGYHLLSSAIFWLAVVAAIAGYYSVWEVLLVWCSGAALLLIGSRGVEVNSEMLLAILFFWPVTSPIAAITMIAD